MGSFQEGHVPLSYWALWDYFTKSLDMEHGVDVIYLDFQKTFDTALYHLNVYYAS